MAELLFQLRTAHGVMSSQPGSSASEGLAGIEDLPPGWVIYVHRLHSVLGRWLQCLTFSLVSSEQAVFQNRTPSQCSDEAEFWRARIPEDGGSCGQSAVYHLRDFFS